MLYKISKQRRDKDKKPPYGARLNPRHPLSQNLVDIWLLNEGGGKTVWGQNNPGTLSGLVTWESSPFGPTLDFHGTQSTYVSGTNLYPSIWSGPFSACIMAETPIGPSVAFNIGTNKFHILYSPTYIRFGMWDFDLDYIVSNSGYVQVICTLDKNKNRVIYKNGSYGNSDTYIGTVNGDNNWWIGSMSGGQYSTYLESIAYVMVWKRCLSAEEVASLYANPYQMFEWPLGDYYFVPAAAPPPTGGKSIFGYDSIFHAGGIIQT